MPCITSLQHRANQDMTFDHLKATSVNMRHNAYRPVKSVEEWKFFFLYILFYFYPRDMDP